MLKAAAAKPPVYINERPASPLNRFDHRGVAIGLQVLCLVGFRDPWHAMPRQSLEQPLARLHFSIEIAAFDGDLAARQ